MAKYCPIVKHNVTYIFCDDCENKICRKKNNIKNQQKQNTKKYSSSKN